MNYNFQPDLQVQLSQWVANVFLSDINRPKPWQMFAMFDWQKNASGSALWILHHLNETYHWTENEYFRGINIGCDIHHPFVHYIHYILYNTGQVKQRLMDARRDRCVKLVVVWNPHQANSYGFLNDGLPRIFHLWELQYLKICSVRFLATRLSLNWPYCLSLLECGLPDVSIFAFLHGVTTRWPNLVWISYSVIHNIISIMYFLGTIESSQCNLFRWIGCYTYFWSFKWVCGCVEPVGHDLTTAIRFFTCWSLRVFTWNVVVSQIGNHCSSSECFIGVATAWIDVSLPDILPTIVKGAILAGHMSFPW